MSTKTTFKRIALVAVATLGLGVLSVAPSQAAHLGDTLTLTPPASSSITVGETATATVNSSFLGVNAGDSITVNALIASKPSTGAANLQFAVIDSYTSTVSTASSLGTTSNISTGVTGNSVAANTNYKLNLVAPTVKGTYIVQVYATAGSGGGTIRSAVLSWSVTVADVNKSSDATSTSFIAAGAAIPAVSDSASVTLSKSGGQAATILVTQKNATSTADEAMIATITGPGLLGSGAGTNAAATGRSISVTNTHYITVWSDGTSGEATITIVGVTSGLTLGVEKVTFFDTKPASVTVTVKKAHILAGTANVTKVLAVVVKDASGNAVTNATVTAAATDTTTAVGGAATCLTYDTTDKVYYCGIAGLSATKFGKVNYTVTASDGAAVATKATSTADVTFSFGVAKAITVSGPATAGYGEEITLTFTATDANGLPVADQSYEGAAGAGILWNTTTVPAYVGSGFAPFNTGETITTVSGVATKKVVTPTSGPKATATWTLAGDGVTAAGAVDKSIGKTTVAYEVTLTNPGVDAATDAANEATDAANAATDAALAAAEAADAATSAAQEASDAVAALSESVTKLIAGLQAQIKSLAAVVAKIAKKVKA
jgi:hypothetical protein